MIELHLPWLELLIGVPLVGAIWVSFVRDPDRARMHSLVFSAIALICAGAAWADFATLHTFEAQDHQGPVRWLLHHELFTIDELSAPLLPLAALIYFLAQLSTMRTKVARFSFTLTLCSETILLATFACKSRWGIAILLALGAVPLYVELLRRGKPTRVFAVHMGLFAGLLIAGEGLISMFGDATHPPVIAVLLLAAAVLLRSGVVPVHCWMTDLFEHASFGSSLLYVTPMAGAYGAMRLVLPVAPSWVLESIAILSLITAVYAAGMATVQREARRFFTYLFLSHSSLVLVGLEIATPVGLTGALCVWVSVGLSLTGFGLALRSVEARTDRLSLTDYHGLYEQMPMLATFFLLTGLASIGFPGTMGFVGTELLVEGAVQVSPWVGTAVVIAGAINGLSVLRVYFLVFTGRRHSATIDLSSRPSERAMCLVLTVLIFCGGLYPQPHVASRYHAAVELTSAREALMPPQENSLRRKHHLSGLGRLFAGVPPTGPLPARD